ncbi:MAG: hypothetical protein HQK76_18440 [Desulfobacterales bacterium]|nr:hypothetical protein [Desulfobacterales bacterium]
MKKRITLYFATLFFICIGILIIKLYCIDVFNACLILKVKDEDVSKFDTLSKLEKGDYCACEYEINEVLKKIGKTVNSNEKYIAIKGYQFMFFHNYEFHGVKGDIIVNPQESEYIFIYSYNPRFDIPYNIILPVTLDE